MSESRLRKESCSHESRGISSVDDDEEASDPRFMSRKERLRQELIQVMPTDEDWGAIETRQLFSVISKASVGVDVPEALDGLKALLQLSPYDVASQLTVLMHNCGYSILSAASLTSSDRRKTNLGVRVTMRFFEVCSTWPQIAVFQDPKTSVSKRIHILGYFVDVCAALRDLRNYHALFAVVGGMTSPCMDWLWRKAHRKDIARFEPLKRVISAGNNYRVYPCGPVQVRWDAAVALHRHVHAASDAARVFGVYHAKDSKLINFDRCRKIKKVVTEYLSAQSIEYNIAPDTAQRKVVLSSLAQADVDQDVAVVLSKIAYKEHKGRRGERTFHKARLALRKLAIK